MPNIVFILTISISAILEYYAILCIICMPLNFFLLLFLSKRTNILQKIDSYIDRMLPEEKKPAAPAPTATDNQPTKPSVPDNPMPSEEDIETMSGISSFEILVKETYKCHVNFHNRGGSYGGMIWFNDNEFVGQIKEDGLFTANKVGTARIFCASKGHGPDYGAQAYTIKVVSALGPWFADRLIEQVSDKMSRTDIMAKNVRRKLQKEVPTKNIMVFAGHPTERSLSLTLQFGHNAKLLRGCYSLTPDMETYDDTVERLNEHFEEIKIKTPGSPRIWIHQIIDNEHEEVDIYAILYQTSQRELLLGIGQIWREYGEKEEFVDNVRMALRSFSDIISFDVNNIEVDSQTEKKEKIEETEEKQQDDDYTQPSDDEIDDGLEIPSDEELEQSQDITDLDGYADFNDEEE